MRARHTPAVTVVTGDEVEEVPVRVAVTVLLVVALAAIGITAAMRVLDRQEDDPVRADADAVAAAWATATAAGDVDALVDLAAERTDTEALRATHAQLLPLLGDREVVVEGVRAVEGPSDNRVVATLSWSVVPGESEGAWTWTSELELIRGRGLWSVDWGIAAFHPSLQPGWSMTVAELAPARAPILDREGRALSPTGANVEIGVQPGRLPERGRLLSTVAGVLPEARSPLTELLERDDLVDDWYYPLVTVSAERAEEAWGDLVSLPGLIRRDAEGGVGVAAAAPEIVGSVEVGEDGARVGAAGLEAVYDDRLTGSATTEVRLVDPDGDVREVLFTFQSDPAPPLVTTLDRDAQQAVDDAVLTVDDPVGVVVLDSGTGGVLAVASRPATGYARALEGRYPPAAIAGLVPLAATLTDGATLAQPLECPDEATVGGVRVTTRAPAAAPGDPTLGDVLAGGCDVALARLGTTVGDTRMLDAVAALGLDRPVDLPVAARGWSWPAAPNDAALASWAVGHGRVESSALGVAQLLATIARGAPATPVVLADEAVTDAAPLPTDVVAGLRTALRTAGDRGPVQVAGRRVAGMAAVSGAVGGDPAPATGWWAGFLDDPDVAIAVVVEDGDDARAVAIAQRVLRELAR